MEDDEPEKNIANNMKDDEKEKEIIKINKMIKLPEKNIANNPEYNKLFIKVLGNLQDSKEFYAKIEKDKKGKINPRIPGIFIMFDNINFYFQQFQKYRFFDTFKTSIPKSLNEIENSEKVFEDIEDYIKNNTNIQTLLASNKINMDDIISDYILYFIDKRDKLTKDSCDIKYFYKILSNLLQIKKKNLNLDNYKFFIEIIILFNCFGPHITYPLNAIKYLNDEKIIKDIYAKILKEFEQYEKESNIIYILIESFFNVLIKDILSNNEIMSKLYYIHLFIMNIINVLKLPNKSFYVFMQFRSLYNLIKKENQNELLNKVYSEIYKLKDIFKEQSKNEALNLYKNFYEKIRTEYKINNYQEILIFIVDFFEYELKKYNENEELFPIILDVLSEDFGSAFTRANKIFNIFLKKYLFKKPPSNEEECTKILENSFKIKKGNIKLKNKEKEELNNDINNEIIESKNEEEENIKKEPMIEEPKIKEDEKEEEIKKEEPKIEEEKKKKKKKKKMKKKKEENDFDEIKNEEPKIEEENKEENIFDENKIEETENNEKEIDYNDIKNEENEKEVEKEEFKEDLFLKKYNEIINIKGNEKIKIKIDEIIQQVFGFYFNGYFRSYLDGQTFTNKYSWRIDGLVNDNKLFLKKCIDYLETIEKPFNGKEISIFLANAFIQSFLYIFIKYFYENINEEKEYEGEYDIGKIFDIIKGKSKFRRVVQIYVFRLIYNNINNPTFEKFKKFEVKNDVYKSFLEQFLEKYSFDDPPFKLLFYCKKIFEDFFFDDSDCLPKNYKLSKYEFDNSFPYDNNIINIKMINNNNISTNSINYYENNSQFISRLAILILSNAATDLINEQEIKEINDELIKIFKNKGKYFNTVFNGEMFELTGELQLILIKELKNLLKQNNKANIDNNQDELYIPEITKNNFLSDNNDINKYNQRVLGIFLYALKISLSIFIFDNKEKYFYSYLTMSENSSEKIKDILNNSYIPGYDLNQKGLKGRDKDIKYYFNNNDYNIASLTLRFILYSNLLFDLLTKKLNEEDINNYSLYGNYSCLRMLFLIWNALEKKLIENKTPIIEIYFNLIIKFLPYILKKCTIETIKDENEIEKFEKDFKQFIDICLENYKEYSLNFIDTRMKFIIQELNNPLKYDFNEFPLLTYYTTQSKPNRDLIINKINEENKDNFLILNNFFDSKNTKIEDIELIFLNLFNIGKYFTSLINDKLIIIIKQIGQYKKINGFIKEFIEKGLRGKDIEAFQFKRYFYGLSEIEPNVNQSINKFNETIERLINDKIKNDNNYKYLINEIYEEKEIFNSFDFEYINFKLSEISKYEHCAFILSEYMYRKSFDNDHHAVDYYNYKNYEINLTEVDEHLFSILFFNKKIFMDVDYSKKFYISKFDLFNKISHNQSFLKNYLIEYPTRDELTLEQIKQLNNTIEQIIKRLEINEVKNNLENDIKKEIEMLKKNIEEKKSDNNYNEYDKLLEIKKIEEQIDKKQHLINILNYKYEKAISSLKVKFIIDICFSLRELLHYNYSLNLNEEMPLLYILDNLQLFRFEKEKLILLIEHNDSIKLSHLFSLYEYFESLIFPIFIYQINNGYFTQIPKYLSKKILYIFNNEEIKRNINFTKIEFIETIRKCICRYITSSRIGKDYIVEELDKDLFELLLKEDLWGKNCEMSKIKESFDYINNYIKFPLKVKHIFNLFELLINIENKNYLSLANFEEKKDKTKEKNQKLIFKNVEK